jgi:ATP-binding cassette, subfamily F, member 3
VALSSVQNGALRLGAKTIFSGLNLQINRGDKIGLIGPNGSGKSTLLKVFYHQLSLDEGTIQEQKDLSVGYLSQDLVSASEQSLRDFIMGSVPGIKEVEETLAHVETELAGLDGSPVADQGAYETRVMHLSTRLAELHQEQAAFEGRFGEHGALRVLAGLGFSTDDFRRPVSEFSGGWRIRAVLGAQLFRQPDLLLLDEPTNHLDMPSVAWFSRFLLSYSGSVVLVTHDSEFLNEQVNRIVSFEPEGVRHYKGNWQQYKKQREEEKKVLGNRTKNLQREREKAQDFINRFRAQANKARQVQSRVNALEKMESVDNLENHQEVAFSFPPTERVGKKVASVDGLTHRFGQVKVFSGIKVDMMRGQKIALVGPNGAGKTTFLKILAQELVASEGTVTWGHRVKVGYYAQHHGETLHSESTPYDEVLRRSTERNARRVRSILGALLFSGSDVDKKIGVLSGGEKARVALAGMLVSSSNTLILDEPTNHLDIMTSERLAEALRQFDGTIIFVSHNRSFIRTLADDLWAIEGGKLEPFMGSFDDYIAQSRINVGEEMVPKEAQGARGSNRTKDKQSKRQEAQLRAQRRKALKPLKERLGRLEHDILASEQLQSQCEQILAEPEGLKVTQTMGDVAKEYDSIKHDLGEMNAAWEKIALEIEELEAEMS